MFNIVCSFFDGKFKSCGKQFTQIYTIHADLDGRTKDMNVLNVAFALLPNKKNEKCVRLFRLIFLSGIRPKSVYFEAARISGLR